MRHPRELPSPRTLANWIATGVIVAMMIYVIGGIDFRSMVDDALAPNTAVSQQQ